MSKQYQAFGEADFEKNKSLPSPGKDYYDDLTGWKILLGTFMFFSFLGCIAILAINADIDKKVFQEDDAEKITEYTSKDRYKGASLASSIISGGLFGFLLIVLYIWFRSIYPQLKDEDRLSRDLSYSLRSGDRLANLSGLLSGYVYPSNSEEDIQRRGELGEKIQENMRNALAQELYYEKGLVPTRTSKYADEFVTPGDYGDEYNQPTIWRRRLGYVGGGIASGARYVGRGIASGARYVGGGIGGAGSAIAAGAQGARDRGMNWAEEAASQRRIARTQRQAAEAEAKEQAEQKRSATQRLAEIRDKASGEISGPRGSAPGYSYGRYAEA